MTIQKRNKKKRTLTNRELKAILAEIHSCQITDWKTANTIIQNRRRERTCTY